MGLRVCSRVDKALRSKTNRSEPELLYANHHWILSNGGDKRMLLLD
jgi:hypothetical protein